MAASNLENHTPFGALNTITHMVDGDNREFGDNFSKRDTLIGTALNGSAMLSWAVLYRLIFPSVRLPIAVASGTVLAVAAYITDYHIVPKRFTPGFEKKISGNGIFLIYALIAVAFASLPPITEE